MKAAFTPGTTFAGYRIESLVGSRRHGRGLPGDRPASCAEMIGGSAAGRCPDGAPPENVAEIVRRSSNEVLPG